MATESARGVVAFATCEEFPDISGDDSLLATALRKQGIEAEAAIWDSPLVNWSRFDAVLIRSTWDYHLKSERYEKWLQSFLAASGNLWNHPEKVLSNINKRYLLELGDDVKVIPTKYISAGERHELGLILESQEWSEVVIKPAISAGARATWKCEIREAKAFQHKFAAQTDAEDTLVQEYFPEIAEKGEWSLIFFGGEYSHAVLKRPAAGDFRVQGHAGGKWEAAQPPTQLVSEASSILERAGGPFIYARVDGLERDQGFVLMELEINEPCLFFGFSHRAASAFADLIVRSLRVEKR